MLYRIKQFFSGVTAKIDSNDRAFVEAYLNETEINLFYSLPIYEQAHSIRVAREVLRESLENQMYDILLVKAALLHDIGKLGSGLNLITKSILVLLEKAFPNLLRRFSGINMINAYYHHAEIAVTILNDEDDYIRYLIKNHHNYSIKNDKKLLILQRADSNN